VSVQDDLRDVVALLVDEPERIEIDQHNEGGRRTLDLRVADEDLGKVIGRQGRTARALRRFLAARPADDSWDLNILD
jgi:predicted RNA-binding protein YlqC (UPF0109 family)